MIENASIVRYPSLYIYLSRDQGICLSGSFEIPSSSNEYVSRYCSTFRVSEIARRFSSHLGLTMGGTTSAVLGSTNKFFIPWLIPRNNRDSVYAPNLLGKLVGATGRKRRDVDLLQGGRHGLVNNFLNSTVEFY